MTISLTGNPDFPKSADSFEEMKAVHAKFVLTQDALKANPRHDKKHR